MAIVLNCAALFRKTLSAFKNYYDRKPIYKQKLNKWHRIPSFEVFFNEGYRIKIREMKECNNLPPFIGNGFAFKSDEEIAHFLASLLSSLLECQFSIWADKNEPVTAGEKFPTVAYVYVNSLKETHPVKGEETHSVTIGYIDTEDDAGWYDQTFPYEPPTAAAAAAAAADPHTEVVASSNSPATMSSPPADAIDLSVHSLTTNQSPFIDMNNLDFGPTLNQLMCTEDIDFDILENSPPH